MDNWYANNKERQNKKSVEYMKLKRKTDPLYKMKCNLRRRIRDLKLDIKPSTLEILGVDYLSIYNHIENSFVGLMNWNNYGEWHIDHIIPLSSAKTDKDKIRLSHYTNLQPLWARDNIAKGSKLM
jgi:hypothetical protein